MPHTARYCGVAQQLLDGGTPPAGARDRGRRQEAGGGGIRHEAGAAGMRQGHEGGRVLCALECDRVQQARFGGSSGSAGSAGSVAWVAASLSIM